MTSRPSCMRMRVGDPAPLPSRLVDTPRDASIRSRDDVATSGGGTVRSRGTGAAIAWPLLEWLVAQGADARADVTRSVTGRSRVSRTSPCGPQAADARPRWPRRPHEPSRIERLRLATGLRRRADERLFSREDATSSRTSRPATCFSATARCCSSSASSSSLARIARRRRALLANVEGPIVERHAGELALAEANLRALQALEAIPNGVRRSSARHMETAIRRLRAGDARFHRDTVIVTVGFVDLVGYTRLSSSSTRGRSAAVERFEPSRATRRAPRRARVSSSDDGDVRRGRPRGGGHRAPRSSSASRGSLVTRAAAARVRPHAQRRLLRTGVNLASRIADLAVRGNPREAEVMDEAHGPFRFEPAGPGRSRLRRAGRAARPARADIRVRPRRSRAAPHLLKTADEA